MRYTRLIFGMAPASEICQREIEKILYGLPCVRNISDDIIIGARSPSEMLERLEQTLQRLRIHGITVNKSKCKFFQSKVTYMGHVLSADGLSPDPIKVEAIAALKSPTCAKEVHSFLGMITYCASFIPNLASLTESLRQLIKKDTPWEWNSVQQAAFDRIKRILA